MQQHCTYTIKQRIDADECDAAFALTFFLTTLVNIYIPILLYFLRFVVTKLS